MRIYVRLFWRWLCCVPKDPVVPKDPDEVVR